MSQSPIVAATVRRPEPSSDRVRAVVATEEVQEVLDALGDPDCRDILDVTTGEALSANEVSEDLDLPLSTTYRKLELLTDTGLLEERTRIRRSGKHASEYARSVESVLVSLDPFGETRLRVSRREDAEPVEASPTAACGPDRSDQ
jgi:DNA-binding transcriptional ArsR family regulator